MRAVVLLQQDPNRNKRKKGIVARIYHCASCNSFVSRETVIDILGALDDTEVLQVLEALEAVNKCTNRFGRAFPNE